MSYKDHIDNEAVCIKVQAAIRPYTKIVYQLLRKGSYDDMDNS